jgi:hypothetical protein
MKCLSNLYAKVLFNHFLEMRYFRRSKMFRYQAAGDVTVTLIPGRSPERRPGQGSMDDNPQKEKDQ